MLHVTKVLCLILAAAVSSVAIGGALFSAQQRYIKAIDTAETSLVSKLESIEQNLESVMERISSRLGQLEQRDDAGKHTILESRRRYDTWKEERREQVLSILEEVADRLHNMRDQVKTYVAMYKQNRILEAVAVRFIEEVYIMPMPLQSVEI